MLSALEKCSALETHVQRFRDEMISGICFKLSMRGLVDVVGVEIHQTSDELIFLKLGGLPESIFILSTLVV